MFINNFIHTNCMKILFTSQLYPPTQDETNLYVKKNQKSGFPLDCYKYNSPIDGYDPDLHDYPLFSKAKPLVFDQLPGELLLIPTGWFHQVMNQ